MSLVDYASSSEEEELEELEEKEQPEHKDEEEEEESQQKKANPDESAAAATAPPRRRPLSPPIPSLLHSSYHHSDAVVPSPGTSMEKLPDASLLLASPSFSPQQFVGTNYSFRAAPAMADSSSRKREPNGSAFIHPRNKHPRGNLPYSKNIPDTVSGALIPPQLKGRSNVVTEDISRLFVKRLGEPSGQ